MVVSFMEVEKVVQQQRAFWQGNNTKPLSFRKKQLTALREGIKQYESRIYEALKADLNKSEYEAFLTEVSMVLEEIHMALQRLDSWAAPKRKKTPLSLFPAKSFMIPEPYGVVLILSPWNYPFQLSLIPAVSAIAAGNCVILKPSRHSTHMSSILEEMIQDTFDPCFFHCMDSEQSHEEILAQRYDYIFFTGSESAGRKVLHAAAEHLTPVTLELGGKSPCFVDRSASLELAAKRIIWGKCLNAGQTCVAPDYILVDRSVQKELVHHLQRQLEEQYPNISSNDMYPKIIDTQKFEALQSLAQRVSGKQTVSSNPFQEKLYPLILEDATFESESMQEEIFGPILPVIGYDHIDTVIQEVKARPKPLACYIFTENRAFAQKVIREISFGGGCINDVVMHLTNPYLPFGGVGSSGMGQYHGKYGFDTFSHKKSILYGATHFDLPFRYPPYQNRYLKWLKRWMPGTN